MKNDKKLMLLLTPSWVVSVVGITLGILLTAGVIALGQYQSSDLSQQFFEAQNSGQVVDTSSYETIADNLSDNKFLGILPMLLIWGGVGFVVYILASAIARSFGKALFLREELEYVHASRQSLVREAVFRGCIQVVAVIGWLAFIKLTFSVALPYIMSIAYAASQEFTIENASLALLSVLATYIVVCVHAVFFRLIALKPRLFGESF